MLAAVLASLPLSTRSRIVIREQPEASLADTFADMVKRSRVYRNIFTGKVSGGGMSAIHTSNRNHAVKREKRRRHLAKYGHCRMGRYHA